MMDITLGATLVAVYDGRREVLTFIENSSRPASTPGVCSLGSPKIRLPLAE
ncbi:hypothetical protein QZM22_00825 [Burkholderia oklahomensis]|uniref:hypothetical protein n=1 Tax=Burkholderia oklahomensis TaxID=342113 RepID=UPI00264FDB60|nr:hypothetical protein [Burkholderia oklahomensis]MDN7671101.1 hypothetical protein [Burkholderia oklahomensis]